MELPKAKVTAESQRVTVGDVELMISNAAKSDETESWTVRLMSGGPSDINTSGSRQAVRYATSAQAVEAATELAHAVIRYNKVARDARTDLIAAIDRCCGRSSWR